MNEKIVLRIPDVLCYKRYSVKNADSLRFSCFHPKLGRHEIVFKLLTVLIEQSLDSSPLDSLRT